MNDLFPLIVKKRPNWPSRGLSRRFMLGAAASATFFTPHLLGATTSSHSKLRFRVAGLLPRSKRYEDGTWTGFEPELTQALVRMAGLSNDIEFVAGMNWRRALQSVEMGEIDLLSTVSFRKERRRFLRYIGEYDYQESFLVGRPEKLPAQVLNNETFLSLGIDKILVNFSAVWESGFDKALVHDTELRRRFRDVSSVPYVDAADFLDKLVSLIGGGYLHAAILTGATKNKFLGHAQKRGIDAAAIKIQHFDQAPTFLASSRHLPEPMTDALIKAYRASRNDGTFDKIWKRWYGDRETPAPYARL